MQSEQQQRIMGYFIEEAKDHLNTIEQGLLSLQSTMEDREMLNEIFRAAHSVKGGAAMLGINSIQQTAHRLEDCFKVLQESPVKADQQLESLFLRVFDTLQALVEQLQSPFGLTDEAAKEIMSGAESVFEELNTHLEKLLKKAEGSSVATVEAPKVTLANSQMNTGKRKTLPVNFKRDVLIELREMLQLFKQQDSPEHREALQRNCRHLVRLGEQLDLPGWGELMETARAAIASPANSYRLLANVVIKEIKQAQELVVAGRSVEIRASEQLKALVLEHPTSESATASEERESEINLTFDNAVEQDAQESETAQANRNPLQDESESSLTNLFESSDTEVQADLQDFTPEQIQESSADQTFVQPELQKTRRIYRFAAPSEPEVGMAELNTLADIFEGQTPDLDETWQEEEIISLNDNLSASNLENSFSLDDHKDFSDLVGDLDSLDLESGASTSNDLMDLFGDDSLEDVVQQDREPTHSNVIALGPETPVITTNNITDDFADLLFEADSPDPLLAPSSASDDLSSLFGDSFFEENSPLEEDFEDFGLDADTTSQSQPQDDEIFTMPVADVFEEAPEAFAMPSAWPEEAIATDPSMEGEDSLGESFITQENEFLAFEDSSQELESLDGDENWLDSAALAESDMDFGDLMEISERQGDAAPEEQELSEARVIDEQASDFAFEELAFPEEQASDFTFEELAFPEEQGLSEARVIDEQATDFAFEELALDESGAAFDFDANVGFRGSEVEDSITAESPPTDLSWDDSFFHTSTNESSDPESFSDLGLEEFMSAQEPSSSDEWNWDEESEIALDDSASFNLEGDVTDTAAADQMLESQGEWDSATAANAAEDLSSLEEAAREESLWDVNEPELALDDFGLAGMDAPSVASDFNFDDLDATSTSPFNVGVESSGDMDNLFEDEALPSSEASQSAALESLEAFEDWLEAPTPETENQSAALESLEAFEDWLEAPTPEVTNQGSEGVEFSGLEELEASSDFDDLNDLFNADEVSDRAAYTQDFGNGSAERDTELSAMPGVSADVFGVDTTARSDTDGALDLDDFSIFDTPAQTDDQEVASPSALQEEAFEELLFDEPNATETGQVADLSDSLFDADESAFFDLDLPEVPSAGTASLASEPLPTSDLEALFGDETPLETDTFDLSAFAPDALNFDADLFAGDSSSPEWSFEAEEEATGEDQALLFEWEEADSAALGSPEVSAAEARAESTALESPSASDVEGLLLGDEIFGDTDSLNVSDSGAGARLRTTENLFETEMASLEEQEPADQAVAADLADLNGESAGAVEMENLDDFLSAETDEVTDAQNWDELFNAAQEVDAPSINIAALSEADAALPLSLSLSDVEAADDEAAALDLDWATQESDLLFAEDPEELAASSSQTFEFEDLEAMLADGEELTPSSLQSSGTHSSSGQLHSLEEFADLEAMLAEEAPAPAAASVDFDMFKDLDALLEEEKPTPAKSTPAPAKLAPSGTLEDEFGDLDSLLKDAEMKMGGSATVIPDPGRTRSLIRPRTTRVFEHTMRVPVKHLDSLSNLVGELVVNRNTLEQDQERLRQFLDNLSHQVLALSDVGSRMQDLYERSLLESSLLASRQSYRLPSNLDGFSQHNHSSGVEYDPLEMDRFTGFHLLSQEMIELIVRVRESASDIEFLVDETDQVARMLRQITTQLQEGLTRSRMVPFAQNADRLLRAVHEIARKLGKEAQLQVEGRETLIDKMILEHLYDPMTHLVNNALTHGIESPQVRQAGGKPRVGKVTLRAFHQGNQTVISISDDGAGIDPERVRVKAVEQKLITPGEAKTLTNVELYDCLFHPGFSTKDKADDFSGRGVGMDVVRTSLSEIRGTIHIDSARGKGTTFTIRLPLTLSICKALCCLSDRARIAFPMDGVEDAFDMSADRIQTNSDGQKCISWRDSLLPFQSLSELLTYKRQPGRNAVYGGKREDDMISIIVLRSAGNFLAIQVDQVLGEQEIVIKQLEGPPPKPVGIAGATVLGDGRIMAIADVLELIDLANGRIRKDGGVAIWPREEPQVEVPQEITDTKTEPMVLIVDDSITVRELLSMTFSKSGYRVEQARDGQEAWDKLRSGLPCDIVFCDIEMPRMDGLELLSRLQKDEKLMNLPIAMLTSRGADRHRQMASQLGASGYFTKPYLEEVLLDAAQRMIRGEVLFSSNSNA